MTASLEAALASLLIGHQLEFFVTLVLLVLLVLLAMALVLRRAGRRAEGELAREAAAAAMPPPDDAAEPAPPKPADTTPLRMWHAVRQGIHAYRLRAGGLNGAYAAPWILLLGSTGAGKTALLEAIGPSEPPTVLPDAQTGTPVGCAWWFYDEAVVIEVPGHVTRPRSSLSDGAWRMLLRLLRWHRPRRPVDAVVVALPLTDLLGPDRLDPTALLQKARGLQARLFQAQGALGFCLPVHVVLTRGDTMPGFAALAAALPAHMRDGIFGWSNPHALDAAYAGTWLADGFAELDAALLQLQLELHAAGAPALQPEAMFQLHSQLHNLREPLDRFLAVVFRRTVFQESLFFRGVSLTAAAPESPALFARALFRQKIFAERDLSRPTPAFSLGAGRRRRIAQAVAGVAALLLLGGIWREGERAGDWRDAMVPLLHRLADTQGAPETRVRLFAADMAGLEPPFHSPLLPGSWLGLTNQRVAEALARDYRRTLLGGTRERLEAALRELVAGNQPALPGSELDRLRAYVEQVGAVEAGVARYDAVAADPTGAEVGALLADVWGIAAPPDLRDRIVAWQMADERSIPRAGAAEPLALGAYHTAAVARLEQLAQAACDRLASGGSAVPLLARVAADLEAASQPSGKVDQLLAALRDARDGLHEAAPQIGADPDSWAGARSLAFSPGVQAILDGIGRSALLGQAERDRIVAGIRRRFAASDEASRLAQSVVGPLLTRDGSGQVVLSAVAASLEGALRLWLDRPFLRVSPPGAARNDAPGWNPQMLTPAGSLTEDYLSFEAKDIANFPPALQPVVRAVSRLRLQQNLLDVVFRANGAPAVGLTDSALRDQAMRLAAAAPHLVDIMHTLGQLGAAGSEAQLRDMLRQQARMLLAAVDRLLAQDALYQISPAALQASAEQALPNYILFGQPDAPTLEQTLAQSRQRVSTLARGIAAPLVGVLALPDLARPGGDETRWSATNAELDKFDAQRPGNAVAALETFILVDLADPAGACAKVTAPDLGGYGADIFSLHRRQLRANFAARCSNRDGARLASSYSAIAEGFDRLLAGRYPFARPGAPDVSAYALLSFYDLFDRNLPGVNAASAAPDISNRPGDGAASFIASLQSARPLVAPASGTGEDANLQVEVQFRANRGAEQGGDQIIEWRLTSGTMSASSLEPHKPLVWHPGDPVKISLRWAKDAHAVPVAPAGGLSHVEGNTLTYSFNGGWALFSMLQALHGDAVSMAGNLIAIPFRTQGGTDSSGQVFAILSLRRLGDEKAARLTVPHFPIEVPSLGMSSNVVAPLPRGVIVPPLLGAGHHLASE